MTLKITYVGHATVLIEWNGIAILTDPVFSKRILWFYRAQPLAFDPARLPKLDAIVLSHAHYDHLDLFSYKFIPGDVPILIPEGMSKAIAPFVNNPVLELSTWSNITLPNGCKITAVPARHPGGRFIVPWRYRTCHGYVFSKNNEHIYFAGDTAYGPHFAKIGAAFPLRLALLPYATLQSKSWSKFRHLSLQTLLQTWRDLGQPNWIPYHWGSFFTGINNPTKMMALLKGELRGNAELAEKATILHPGEVKNFESPPG